MSQVIVYRRITPGLYKSVDGRVTIERHYSMQTGRRTDTTWMVILDGQGLLPEQNTLYDAKRQALQKYNNL
jgi:hypothetical protein